MSLRLETPRLVIRAYTMADLDDVADVLADPEVFWWVKEPFTHERARLWLQDEMRCVRQHGIGRYAVVCKEAGRVIGGAGLVPRELDTGREVELGYHLHRHEWGRGYATEAARACLTYAWEIGLDRVIALIYVDNPRSEAVARRLGMAPERELVWAGLPHRMWVIEVSGGEDRS
jgi:ribosomal-protein-alanine N-acetyltransferase